MIFSFVATKDVHECCTLSLFFSPLRLQFPLFRLLFLFLGGLHLLNYLDIADLSIYKTRFFFIS